VGVAGAPMTTRNRLTTRPSRRTRTSRLARRTSIRSASPAAERGESSTHAAAVLGAPPAALAPTSPVGFPRRREHQQRPGGPRPDPDRGRAGKSRPRRCGNRSAPLAMRRAASARRLQGIRRGGQQGKRDHTGTVRRARADADHLTWVIGHRTL